MVEEETPIQRLLKEISQKLDTLQPRTPTTHSTHYKCPGCNFETPSIQNYLEHRLADLFQHTKTNSKKWFKNDFDTITGEIKKLREEIAQKKERKGLL